MGWTDFEAEITMPAMDQFLSTYRGYRISEVLDAEGQPLGKCCIEGFDQAFNSRYDAREAIDVLIQLKTAVQLEAMSIPKPEIDLGSKN